MKTKIEWISLGELKPPKNWSLPFEVIHNGKKYKVTGVDYIDQLWRVEEI